MSNTTRKTRTTPTAAELSRMAVAEARELYAMRRAAKQQAEEAAEELVVRLAMGDETPTAVDLSQAEHEVKRAGLLVQAAETKVKRAERAQINDDTQLAELLRSVLADLYGKAVPIVVTGVPAEAMADLSGQPVLYIVQPKPTTTAGGVLSGLLDIVLYRPFLYAPLDAGRVDESCRTLGFAVQTHQLSTSTTGDLHRDDLRLTVNRAFHPVPVLAAEPTDETVREFALTLNGDLLASVTTASPRPTITGQPVPGRASSLLRDARVTSTVPGEGGTVRVTVTTSHEVTRSAGLPEHYANLRLRAAVAALDGRVADGVGRVVAAEAVAIDMGNPARPDAARMPWNVTTRFVLEHRLA
ncbi:hypothetical protein SAMN05660464_3691 [Geodermatophilus dictyosporus]|uniref:Uncharacterized protein n=1 Tax=Geodermatophilus dictyosporus TaxID=1523247 RepID=A0A1I5RSC3_9ACTN|nr:hypothetical protein [Geodermatophilus dictyosporus]SFP61408.1 hypothetical protein SAMN05660464_3691 [Geodermatophilus dictyosporus]